MRAFVSRPAISGTGKIVWLAILAAAAAFLFIAGGLDADNIGYFLPKRLAKILAIAVSAWCIGYTAVTFQTITCNRILTPSVMGLDTLYLFIQTVVICFFGSGKLEMMSGYGNFLLSVAIMTGASGLLFLLLFGKMRRSVYFLLLAGLVAGALFQSLATFMQVMMDPNEFLFLQGKMFASFNNINTGLLGLCTVICLAVIVLTWRDCRQYDVLALGPEQAISLGISYRAAILKSLIVTAVLVSVSTALTGPVTFLGILVANLARQLTGSFRHSRIIACSVLLGCLFLTTGQWLTERVFQFSTTVSVIINFIGGLYFIFLILKDGKT